MSVMDQPPMISFSQRRSGSELLPLAKREFIEQDRYQNVPIVEIGRGAVEQEVVNVRGGRAVGRAQPPAGGCAGRIRGLIINRMAQGVRQAKRQALLEPPPHREGCPVVIRVAARVLEEDLVE